MAITQLIYYSRNKTVGNDRTPLESLRQILKTSRDNNQRDGVTGYLIFDKTWFLQTLEGEAGKVQAAYQRIQKDSRHGEVVLMGMREIKTRSFPRWSMGGSMRSLDKQEIFLRHGIGGPIDPTKLSYAMVLGLAMDLQDFEHAEQSAARLAG